MERINSVKGSLSNKRKGFLSFKIQDKLSDTSSLEEKKPALSEAEWGRNDKDVEIGYKNMSKKTLYRAGDNRIIAGVCAGVAEFFNIDPAVIRLIWLLSVFAGGAGIWAYLAAWAIVPENPKMKRKDLSFMSKVDIKEETRKVHEGLKIHGKSPLFGLVLMIIGVVFLANNFFPQLRLDKYWPIIPIALGLVLIFSSHNNKK